MYAPPSSQPYFDLGNFHRSITTKSSECQTWFDRGVAWAYGFNHQESAKCFQYAISHDDTCAMAYWGLAYVSGPNYNKQWKLFDELDLAASLDIAYTAAKKAEANIGRAGPVEEALVKAIQLRYQADDPKKITSRWNVDYADAMKAVYERFPDDLDVAALYADAMMCLTPWALWDLKTGEPAPRARTLEIKQVLEKALTINLSKSHFDAFSDSVCSHPGVLHAYVHLMEMSSQPELALNVADKLRDIIPDAGHLRHMPSHIDVLVGDYRRAIVANTAAVVADEKYLAVAGHQNFYTLYRSHVYHSLIYAAMFAGKANIALEAARKMEASMPESLLRVQSPPMADWLESYIAVRPHVLIRFGRWKDIHDLALPLDQKLYCVTTATVHYAKAIAAAAQGLVDEAAVEQRLFEEALRRIPSSRRNPPNSSKRVLNVGRAMLDGELEYRRGNIGVAFTHLQHAVDLDDALLYSEPWGWMLPARHAFAALLLEQNQVERAAAMYRADLGFDHTLPRARQHPNNVWALHGYHECLKRLGKTTEADLLSLQLQQAVAVADVKIGSSCFCRANL